MVVEVIVIVIVIVIEWCMDSVYYVFACFQYVSSILIVCR